MRGYYAAVGCPPLPPNGPTATKTERTLDVQHDSAMHKLLLIMLIVSALALSGGCVYRASISQGNLIAQDDLDQAEVGMTRIQIRFLLGTPMIDDPFHKDRWDYIYYLKIGRDDAAFKRWISVLFENDIVIEIRKDLELAPGL